MNSFAKNIPRGRPRSFSPRVSIVLIGSRGSGLSSLSVIAASGLQYEVIEIDKQYAKTRGRSKATSIREYGLAAYCDDIVQLFGEVLQQRKEGHVIVCGNEIFEPRIQNQLQSHASHFPVVMVSRDRACVLRHLRVSDQDPGFTEILEQSQKSYRKLSNFEFYNLPEEAGDSPTFSRTIRQTLPGRRRGIDQPRCLHHLKADFIGFLHAAIGIRHSEDLSLQPRDPEARVLTRVLELPLEAFADPRLFTSLLDECVDAFQLTIDASSISHDTRNLDLISRSFSTIRRHSHNPIIYHVQRVDKGEVGLQRYHTTSRYLHLVQHGIRLLPEYLSIDLSCDDPRLSQLCASVSSSKLIGHQNFGVCVEGSWMDKSRHDAFDRAVKLECRLVRFEQDVTHDADNRECFAFIATTNQRSNVPLIAYNLTSRGRPTMIMNQHMTPVTSQLLAEVGMGRQLLTSRDIERALYSNFTQEALRFYVYGANVDFSLAPSMYSAAFRHLGMPHSYVIRQSDNLPSFSSLMSDDFGGASLSLPYKRQAIGLLKSLSEPAEMIGAINTVLPIRDVPIEECSMDPRDKRFRNRSGPIKGLYGDNTDWIGIYTCVSRNLSPANTVNERTTALVIGAGGMARAAIYALASLGVRNIVIWNRTPQKAAEVAEHFKESSITTKPLPWLTRQTSPHTVSVNDLSFKVLESLSDPWPADLEQPIIIVCAIPQHQIGNSIPPRFTVPPAWFRSPTGGVIVELSYKIPTTTLLQQAYDCFDKGWIAVEPLEILVEQGCAQFELFTGCRAPRKVMQEEVLAQYMNAHGPEKA